MCPAASLFLLILMAADYNADGIKALDARDYPTAIQLFGKAVAEDGADYGARFHLALALSLAGRTGEAIPEYKKVLELKPGLYEAELNLGILLLGANQPADALPYLKSAAEKKSTEPRPLSYLAEVYLLTGDLAQAERTFTTLIGLDSKSAAARSGLARTLAKQNRLAEAAPRFKEAAALDPSYRDGLLELASLFEAAKQPGDAIALYEQFPENAGAQERLGVLLVEVKRYTDAIARLEPMVARSPSSANRLALANAYRLNKEPDKALPLLEQVISAEATNYDVRMLHGAMLRDQKQFAPAARAFFSATKIRPDSKEAWNELSGMLIMMEDFPQALAALDRVKALGGEIPAHHFFRAIILDKTKQYQPALASYQQFLAVANGQFPDEEFQSRQRVRIIKKELERR